MPLFIYYCIFLPYRPGRAPPLPGNAVTKEHHVLAIQAHASLLGTEPS